MTPSRSLPAVALALLLVFSWAAPVFASVVPYMSLEDLERQGGVVVLGEVRSVTSMMSEDGRIIVTRATVRVERALKGGPRAEVTIEVPGGTLNGTTLVASGAPRFTEGERVVLFLEEVHGRFGVAGWNQGRFTVRRDPRTGRDLVTQPGGGSLYVDAQGHPAPRDPRLAGPRVLEDFLRDVEGIMARAGHARGSS